MTSPRPAPRTATSDLSALRIDSADRSPDGRRRPPWWLLVVALVLGGAAALLPRWIEWPWGTTTVRLGTATLDVPGSSAKGLLSASGYVVPRIKASVSAKVAGRLELVAVEEGDRVEKGALLARLENADLVAQVAARQAQLAERKAGSRRAWAERDLAAVEERRERSLLAAEVGTDSAVDSAAARARAKQAGAREADAGILAAEAQLRLAQIALADADVLAPFTGVILRREAEVGESVAPAIASGQSTRGAIVTMADLDSLEVEVAVAESNIARIPRAAHAEVTLDAIPGRRYLGRVRQVLPTADRQKATVQVTVALLDADTDVKPEMGARVVFLAEAPESTDKAAAAVVSVPASAVRAGSGGAEVLVATAEGRVSLRAVRLGPRSGDRVTVLDGLSGGEQLVLDPPAGLADGARVRAGSK